MSPSEKRISMVSFNSGSKPEWWIPIPFFSSGNKCSTCQRQEQDNMIINHMHINHAVIWFCQCTTPRPSAPKLHSMNKITRRQSKKKFLNLLFFSTGVHYGTLSTLEFYWGNILQNKILLLLALLSWPKQCMCHLVLHLIKEHTNIKNNSRLHFSYQCNE